MSVRNDADLVSVSYPLRRRRLDAVARDAPTVRVPLLVCAGIMLLAGIGGAQAQSFAPPVLAVANYGYNAGGWRVDRHPRLLGDVNGDGRADIVGFGNAGAFVSLGQASGLFANPVLAVANFGYDAGGWRVDLHPRLLGDVNGDGRADIVGFGNAGAFVSLGQANGLFASPVLGVANFGAVAGGWRVGIHPRLLGDVNGDGRADIVGFGNAGAYVSLGQANGRFANPVLGVANFGAVAGGWRVDRHPRLLGDVNGDGRDDIVGFGNAGAYVSLGQANGRFANPVLAVNTFGYNSGGWQVDRHPRLLGDVNGDGRADIVGFGNAGAYVALGQVNGRFANPVLGVANFGYDAGGWRVDRHPRLIGDVNGEGRADIVGFGNAGTYVSLGQPDGRFANPVLAVDNFGYDAGGWRVEYHPRDLGDVNGNGQADIVGFGNAGAYVSLAGQPREHILSVRRFQTSALTNADADQILADATTVLRVSDGSDDVATNVRFSRTGDVGGFNTGNGTVNSAADFSAIIALDGDIKIVNAINWCGGPGVGIIGCAPTPGGSLAVVRFSANREGILWAHEFGHNQALPHRAGNNFVMNPFITTTARRVNQTESDAYRQPTPAIAGAFVVASPGEHEAQAELLAGATIPADEDAAVAGGIVLPPAAAGRDPTEGEGIEAFVRRFYVHGVPYDEATRFDETAVPRLLEMLADPEEKPYWPNIVGVLGIIGDASLGDDLIAFIEGNKGQALDPETYRAALSAVISLGYLANRTGEYAVVEYLADAAANLPSAETEADETEDRSGAEPDRTPSEGAAALRLDDGVIAQSAVWGLALSGQPEARAALERLMSSPELAPDAQDPAENRAAQNLVSDALDVLSTVEAAGLSEYYREEGR
jgi:hypothetical protein